MPSLTIAQVHSLSYGLFDYYADAEEGDATAWRRHDSVITAITVFGAKALELELAEKQAALAADEERRQRVLQSLLTNPDPEIRAYAARESELPF